MLPLEMGFRRIQSEAAVLASQSPEPSPALVIGANDLMGMSARDCNFTVGFTGGVGVKGVHMVCARIVPRQRLVAFANINVVGNAEVEQDFLRGDTGSRMSKSLNRVSGRREKQEVETTYWTYSTS